MVVDDLISRQAAIKLLEEWADGYSYLEVPVSSIAHKLNELPTTEKKGKWLKVYDDIDDFCQCSKCGVYGEPTYYCPNCGARMEGI